jgi:hypothetical protein
MALIAQQRAGGGGDDALATEIARQRAQQRPVGNN